MNTVRKVHNMCTVAVGTWKLQKARPKKYTGPTLAAKGGREVAVEELTLCHEGIEYS